MSHHLVTYQPLFIGIQPSRVRSGFCSAREGTHRRLLVEVPSYVLATGSSALSCLPKKGHVCFSFPVLWLCLFFVGGRIKTTVVCSHGKGWAVQVRHIQAFMRPRAVGSRHRQIKRRRMALTEGKELFKGQQTLINPSLGHPFREVIARGFGCAANAKCRRSAPVCLDVTSLGSTVSFDLRSGVCISWLLFSIHRDVISGSYKLLILRI